MGKLSWIIQGAQSNPKGPCMKKGAGPESERDPKVLDCWL